jgi:hypothetical protein
MWESIKDVAHINFGTMIFIGGAYGIINEKTTSAFKLRLKKERNRKNDK